eukprot:COSAG01_NODE_57044_length_314_cov_6.386047_1_plen_25_part_01
MGGGSAMGRIVLGQCDRVDSVPCQC